MNKVYVKHSIVSKIRRFNPWIYANEIDSDPQEFKAGEELTNTLKKKRHVIEKKYKEVIDKFIH